MRKTKINKPLFLVDDEGNKTGVLIKIADFKKMEEELEDYYDYKIIKERSKKKQKTYTAEQIKAEILGKS
ncbi:MAG: hypothetical protein WC436_03675 [Candidatus Babeliales bacterium]